MTSLKNAKQPTLNGCPKVSLIWNKQTTNNQNANGGLLHFGYGGLPGWSL